MKFSRYVKKVEFDSDNLLLRNLFNGALYLIPKVDMASIEAELERRLEPTGNHISELLKEKFLVTEELLPVCLRDADSILLTIETTSDCNLQCSYCYENDKGTRKPISPEVMTQTLRYIENVFKQDQTQKSLCVGFIGGEPLLNKDTVRYLCSEITKLGKHYGRNVSFHFDTNGTIPFDDLFASLDNLQVSVSLTPKPDHNKNRTGKGFDSYERILQNLKRLNRKSTNTLTIRYNTNEINIGMFRDFVSFVKDNIPVCDIIEPMYTDEYPHTSFENQLDIETFKKWNSSEAIDILTENGYDVAYSLGGMLSLCIAYQPYSCKVYTDGSVTLCDAMPHKDSLCKISQICDSPEMLEVYYASIKNYNPLEDPECRQCIDLANCMGKLFCRVNKCDHNRKLNNDVLACTFVKYYLAGKAGFFPNMFN